MCSADTTGGNTIRIFTIGFAKKQAREFFGLLQEAGVKTLIDVRLNNKTQLAGFTKRDDLEYFLEAITGIAYRYEPALAPTKEILDGYKKKEIDWAEYEKRFTELLEERKVETLLSPEAVRDGCFLCSESGAEQCHRRLLVEYLQKAWGYVEIRHL